MEGDEREGRRERRRAKETGWKGGGGVEGGRRGKG